MAKNRYRYQGFPYGIQPAGLSDDSAEDEAENVVQDEEE